MGNVCLGNAIPQKGLRLSSQLQNLSLVSLQSFLLGSFQEVVALPCIQGKLQECIKNLWSAQAVCYIGKVTPGRVVAQLVEACLASMKLQVLSPAPLGLVANDCNPSHSRGRGRRTAV